MKEKKKKHVNTYQTVLINGNVKNKERKKEIEFCGRNDGNLFVVFSNKNMKIQGKNMEIQGKNVEFQEEYLCKGDYALVKVTESTGKTLKGYAVKKTTLNESI